MSMDDLLKFLGFGTPLIFAVATYGIFHFLDKRASKEAKSALSSIFESRPYDPEIIARAILEIFDRLYTRPLFSFKAFKRSAILTIILTTCLSYEIYSSIDHFKEIQFSFTQASFIRYASPQLISNLFTDYLSLFLIRRCLLLAGKRPLTSLIVSFLLGSILVLFMSSVMRWFENMACPRFG